MEISRGDLRQMVRQTRAGATWEQVRVSVPNVNPEWLDAEWKDWVLSAAGPPASDAETPSPPKQKRRKKG